MKRFKEIAEQLEPYIRKPRVHARIDEYPYETEVEINFQVRWTAIGDIEQRRNNLAPLLNELNQLFQAGEIELDCTARID